MTKSTDHEIARDAEWHESLSGRDSGKTAAALRELLARRAAMRGMVNVLDECEENLSDIFEPNRAEIRLLAAIRAALARAKEIDA